MADGMSIEEVRRTLQSLIPDTRYSARVRAYNHFGVASDWSEAIDFTTSSLSGVTPKSPSGLLWDWTNPDLHLRWTAPSRDIEGNPIASPDSLKYKITLFSPQAAYSVSYTTFDEKFIYEYNTNKTDFLGAKPEFDIEIRAISPNGTLSDPVSTTAINQLPGIPPTPTLSTEGSTITVSMSPNIDTPDFKSFLLEHSTDGVSWTQIAETSSYLYPHQVNVGVANRYRYRVKDKFDQLSPYSDGTSPGFVSGTGTRPYATVVVAAVNSSAEGADGADYVCAGFSDQTVINQALNALGSGGKVILLEGNYNCSDRIQLFNSGQHLEGMGYSTIITTSSAFSGLIEMHGSGCTVNNMRLVGQAADVSGAMIGCGYGAVHRSSIREIWIENANGTGIGIFGGEGHIVSGCRVVGGSGLGIEASGTSYSVVVDCHIRDCGLGLDVSGNNKCTFADITIVEPSQEGAYVNNSHYVSFADIQIEYPGSHGFNIRGGTSHTAILDCLIDGPPASFDGIHLSDSSLLNLIQGNRIRGAGTGRYGINISSASCTCNTVINNDLYTGGVTADLNDIGTNTILGPGNRLTSGWSQSFGSDKNYEHTQSSGATTWNIAHNLGKRPTIQAFNGVGSPLMGELTHTDANNAVLTFNHSQDGKAYCN